MSEATAAAPEKAEARPVAKIVSTMPREQQVPLEWPIEFDGQIYESITVRRVTGAEIAAYVEAVAAGVEVKPPMVDCPAEVYAALDDDDLFEVDKVVKDFLPRRFRPENAAPPEASGK